MDGCAAVATETRGEIILAGRTSIISEVAGRILSTRAATEEVGAVWPPHFQNKHTKRWQCCGRGNETAGGGSCNKSRGPRKAPNWGSHLPSSLGRVAIILFHKTGAGPPGKLASMQMQFQKTGTFLVFWPPYPQAPGWTWSPDLLVSVAELERLVFLLWVLQICWACRLGWRNNPVS